MRKSIGNPTNYSRAEVLCTEVYSRPKKMYRDRTKVTSEPSPLACTWSCHGSTGCYDCFQCRRPIWSQPRLKPSLLLDRSRQNCPLPTTWVSEFQISVVGTIYVDVGLQPSASPHLSSPTSREQSTNTSFTTRKRREAEASFRMYCAYIARIIQILKCSGYNVPAQFPQHFRKLYSQKFNFYLY